MISAKMSSYNSLDRSGGGVFHIKRDAAKVALIRAARSTLTFGVFLCSEWK
jgi:hypothetical protein